MNVLLASDGKSQSNGGAGVFGVIASALGARRESGCCTPQHHIARAYHDEPTGTGELADMSRAVLAGAQVTPLSGVMVHRGREGSILLDMQDGRLGTAFA